MSWSLFPPQTREVQFDEKWAFVRKKEAHCEPDESEQGDNWDHVAFDSEHRLVVSLVPGKRTKANTDRLVEDFARRTGRRSMDLITSDEYKPYADAVLRTYGEEFQPPRRPGPGRPPKPRLRPPPGLLYATVHKTRKKGRVVNVEARLLYGTPQGLQEALECSAVSHEVNTAFVERYNATSRHRNARKVRKSYRFSKDWGIHNGMSWFEVGVYNFCWAVRTLTLRRPDGPAIQRTPAMAAGLTDHLWALEEWIQFPAASHLDSS
jgi:hypothetical protein